MTTISGSYPRASRVTALRGVDDQRSALSFYIPSTVFGALLRIQSSMLRRSRPTDVSGGGASLSGCLCSTARRIMHGPIVVYRRGRPDRQPFAWDLYRPSSGTLRNSCARIVERARTASLAEARRFLPNRRPPKCPPLPQIVRRKRILRSSRTRAPTRSLEALASCGLIER